MSLSGHQSPVMETDDWLTPPHWIDALGPFDLDPCVPAVMPWRTAAKAFTKADDGLAKAWSGRVWLNPPFGRQAEAWLTKMADHGNGIALSAARTETRSFFGNIWECADAILFVSNRPHFHYPDGRRAPFNSGAPICLVAYGQENVESLKICDIGGAFVTGWRLQ